MPDAPDGEFLLPLFPLPSVVFFPHTRLPLHIFEPRYREMVGDALRGDGRIGMILLKPGWEREYFGAPEVYSYGTVGAINQVVRLDDGRYNLVLNGVVRFRLLEPIQETPYRIARVMAAPESSGSDEAAKDQRERLVLLSNRFLEHFPGDENVPELATASLDAIVNALVMSLNLSPGEKQELLEAGSIAARSDRVAELMEKTLDVATFLAPYRREGDPGMN